MPAKQKIKIDPITEAKNAIAVFENMQNALKFLNTHVSDMVEFNLQVAKKRLDQLEKNEEKALNEMDQKQLKAFQ